MLDSHFHEASSIFRNWSECVRKVCVVGRAAVLKHVIVLHGFRTDSQRIVDNTPIGSSGSIETNLPAILLLMKTVNAVTARVRDEALLTSQRG